MRSWLLRFLFVLCLWLEQGCLSENQEEVFKLPSYIDVCYRDDPNVADCLKKEIEKLIPIFKSGSKDFDLEPLDPFLLERLTYSYKSSILGGTIDLRNLQLTGSTELKVLDIRAKVNITNKFALDFEAYVPHLNVKTRYIMSGNVLRIPVNIHGEAEIDFDDVSLTYHIDGDVKTVKDYDYLILNNFIWRLNGEGIKHAHLHNTDSVVEGRPILNRIVITVVNSGWRTLIDHIQLAVLPQADKLLTEIFRKFFKKYPYDIIFPKQKKTPDAAT